MGVARIFDWEGPRIDGPETAFDIWPNLLYNLERLGAMAPWPPLVTPMINSSTLGPKGIELTSLIQNPRMNLNINYYQGQSYILFIRAKNVFY